MARLHTVPSRLAAAPNRLQPATTRSQQRMTGRRLQARRLRVWSRDPYCAGCGELTRFPDGFQLDHIVALANGGEDTEGNCQVLCHPCHEAKTRRDLGQAARS